MTKLERREDETEEEFYDRLERRLKEHKNKHRGYSEYGVDEGQKIKYQFVNIANPIVLGIKIAIGMFIVFPLFLVAIVLVVLLFGGLVG